MQRALGRCPSPIKPMANAGAVGVHVDDDIGLAESLGGVDGETGSLRHVSPALSMSTISLSVSRTFHSVRRLGSASGVSRRSG